MKLQGSIREVNDQFRQTFIGGKVLMTRVVSSSPDCDAIIQSVRSFSEFTPDNDPYEEHDFGSVITEDGEEYFWKIDYYDDAYEHYQENGRRVLTIMHSSEY